jgi:hypothetical protein
MTFFKVIDFQVNNGTKIAITLDPLTFILSPVVGGEGRVRGVFKLPPMVTQTIPKYIERGGVG